MTPGVPSVDVFCPACSGGGDGTRSEAAGRDSWAGMGAAVVASSVGLVCHAGRGRGRGSGAVCPWGDGERDKSARFFEGRRSLVSPPSGLYSSWCPESLSKSSLLSTIDWLDAARARFGCGGRGAVELSDMLLSSPSRSRCRLCSRSGAAATFFVTPVVATVFCNLGRGFELAGAVFFFFFAGLGPAGSGESSERASRSDSLSEGGWSVSPAPSSSGSLPASSVRSSSFW